MQIRSRFDFWIILSLNLSLSTKPLVFHIPHLTFDNWVEGGMAGLRSSGSVLPFVVPASSLHATAVARGKGAASAVVPGGVEDLLQDCSGEVGLGVGSEDVELRVEWGGMVERDGGEYDELGEGGGCRVCTTDAVASGVWRCAVGAYAPIALSSLLPSPAGPAPKKERAEWGDWC